MPSKPRRQKKTAFIPKPSSTECDATPSSLQTAAFSLDLPSSTSPSTSSVTMAGEGASVIEPLGHRVPTVVETQAPNVMAGSLVVNGVPNSPSSSNSRSTTPRPPTTASSVFEENRKGPLVSDLLLESRPPLAHASSLPLPGSSTPVPLSTTSGQATPTPGQRAHRLHVNTGSGVIDPDGPAGEEGAQSPQQRVFYDARDGSAIVYLGGPTLNGSGQEQAQQSYFVPGASSSKGTEPDKHSSLAESTPSASSVTQNVAHPSSTAIDATPPQSASSITSTWSNHVVSPITESTPGSRRTSASVDEVLIPPSSASSATFPSSASSLSTSFLSSASSSSLAFSVTSSDWGNSDGGWDPAFVYGFEHGHGERKSDPTYSLKSGYPSPFFAQAHDDAVPRSSISLGRGGVYGDPLRDTEAARLGLSPDPSAASTNRTRFLGSSGRGRRWGIGTVVRALVRPLRASVMWTLSPMTGRNYSSPFLSFVSPFRRSSRPLTTQTTKSTLSSSPGNKPADFTPLFHLCLYFTLNLALTLYNKKVLGKFPFPYTLTAVHALCGWIGTGAMVWWAGRKSGFGSLRGLSGARIGGPGSEGQRGHGVELSGKEKVVLVAFSVLYTVNIVVSNASLRLVTVPFHQVVRASAPFFTILFSALLLGKRSSRRKLLSLVPVVAGVGFATYGDYYFTPLGFFLTLLGTLLAALKTILTNVILVKPGNSSTPLSLPSTAAPSTGSKVVAATTGTDEGFVGIELGQSHNIRHSVDEEKGSRHREIDPMLDAIEENDNEWEVETTKDRTFFGSMLTFAEGVFRKRLSRKRSPSPSSSTSRSSTQLGSGSANPGTFTLALIGLPSVRLPKLSLTPLHLLYLLSPLAFVQTMMLAQVSGELIDVRGWFFGTVPSSLSGSIQNVTSDVGDAVVGVIGTRGARWGLLLNGVMAFMLNVVSFNANRRVGPLGMSVAANVKQVLTILCAVSMFDLTITPANALGIGLTLLGGATYAYVEIIERRTSASSSSQKTMEGQGPHPASLVGQVTPLPTSSKDVVMGNV
ncbi:hypothetical protein CVT24_000261 [Panaeolus cyanescens]|uniref:Sugar phosphate transporter domain-containing protein n=1 Tax=Panaeolus cyanescens TaxID=181874 RepID=A0A409YD99_9AGAR|nr:hypothetical protein CVT24_000261 [Panaeolus cyanescens]